jgi:hypothetical protein
LNVAKLLVPLGDRAWCGNRADRRGDLRRRNDQMAARDPRLKAWSILIGTVGFGARLP